METIPTQSENPKGLHQRYIVEKANGDTMNPNAEYFVLRVDPYGNDPKHIAACRKALMTYANEIKDHLPELSKDLIERYSDSDQPSSIEGEKKRPYTHKCINCGTIFRDYIVYKSTRSRLCPKCNVE
jgi:hypothetical protein